MGTVIVPRPEQCGTIAKTSERERAGPKKRGGGGPPPRDSLRPGFLLEKAWIPRPGPGGNPRRRSGPAPVQQEPPAGGTPRRPKFHSLLARENPLCYDYREYGNLIQKEPCRRPSGRQRIDTMEINGMEVELDLRYSEMNLSQGILQALNQKGFTMATPVQAGAIPCFMRLEGRHRQGPHRHRQDLRLRHPHGGAHRPRRHRGQRPHPGPHPGAGPPDPGRDAGPVRLPGRGSGWPASTAASPSTSRSPS